MAAFTSITDQFNTFVSATLRDLGSKVFDQLVHDVILFDQLVKKGRKRELGGSRQISEALRFKGNTTVMSYTGADELDTAPQDNVTRCFFDWRFYNVAVTIVDTEVDMNASDKHKLFNLVDEKMEDARLSIRDRVNEDLHAVQSGTNFDGLGSHISLSAASLGSIDPTVAGKEWWDNYRVTSGVTGLNLKASMRTMLNTVSKGIGAADRKNFIFVTTQEIFEEYEDQLEDIQRATISEGQDKFGFGMADVLPYRGRPIYWDEDAPADTLKVFNTSFLRLTVNPKRMFQFEPMRRPIDAHSSTAHARLMANLVNANRRASGGLFSVSV